MLDVHVKVEGLEEVQKKLGDYLTPAVLAKANEELGFNVQERTADHIARASVTRHKTADRLGAQYTRFLEYAPGRVTSESPKGGKTYSENATAEGVTVVVENTPGINRAYGDITIRPKAKKALTIPVHRLAYGRSVAELKAEGIKIFRPKNSSILATKDKDGNFQPLYRLMKSVTLKKDEGLLPQHGEIADWAADTMEAFLEARRIALGL